MFLDVVDLRSFYAQPLGIMTRRLLGRAIRERWPDAQRCAIVGLGYATPYLGLFRAEGERTFAFMPGAQGVIKWPSASATLSALVSETAMPLRDATVDRVLAVHALEMTPHPADLLREVWRVLAPGGKLLLVVPNRAGPWTRMDTTPFGQGRPFSRLQLVSLLREALFTPVGWHEALWMPPFQRKWLLRAAPAWERVGATLSLPFHGVHIVEATKQVWRPVPVKKVRERMVFAPGTAPA
ncbi:MAG: class I SAM-dependent methyltransferase [Xanthobacteraceae bacterium]